MHLSADNITFYVYDLIKQSRPGKSGIKVIFKAYPVDQTLCVVKHLTQYIEVTKSLRGCETTMLIAHNKKAT